MISSGTGQTNGQPLSLTTAAQVLHTAPAGASTPSVVRVNAYPIGAGSPIVHLAVFNSVGAEVFRINKMIEADATEVTAAPLVLNGASVIKVWSDVAGSLAVTATVDDQADVAGTAVQTLASGLVAAVQNAARYAVNAQGGTGNATLANTNIKLSKGGVIKNLRASASAAIGGGATVTVAVFVNGVASASTLTLAAADTTVDKTVSTAVTVVAGDLVTFGVTTDNAGAPAANIHACADFVS